jgi:hypothetical protein
MSPQNSSSQHSFCWQHFSNTQQAQQALRVLADQSRKKLMWYLAVVLADEWRKFQGYWPA